MWWVILLIVEVLLQKGSLLQKPEGAWEGRGVLVFWGKGAGFGVSGARCGAWLVERSRTRLSSTQNSRVGGGNAGAWHGGDGAP